MSVVSRVLAVIPARGGSKGLPRKNILPVGGKPLIAWTIEAALKSKCINRVILSSDDDEIIEVAKKYGCDVPFKRPAELATDTATSIDVILHALQAIPTYEYVVLLQPTSPLRIAADIDNAFRLMIDRKAPACVSVSVAGESPYWMYQMDTKERLVGLIDLPEAAQRRQDLPPTYSLNGAVYVANSDWLVQSQGFISNETVGYVMPSNRSIDIDTIEDWHLLKYLVSELSSIVNS